jgi:hypothetical protein
VPSYRCRSTGCRQDQSMLEAGMLDRYLSFPIHLCIHTLTHLSSDPFSMTPRRALESIAVELQRQYERWQSKARYKSSLDPTQDDIKKLCVTLRRNARVSEVPARSSSLIRSRSSRKNVFSFTTMVTVFLGQPLTEKSGCSTRTSLNIFPYLFTTYRNG